MKHRRRALYLCVTGSALLVAAVASAGVAPDILERLRWEALRQICLVFPGVTVLALGLARLFPRKDPFALLTRVRGGLLLGGCMVVVGLGATWSSWNLLRGGPFVPGDEDEYLFQARVFARGRLWWDAPARPAFFLTPGQLLLGERLVGHHQWGHPLLLALAVLASEPRALPICFAVLAIPLCHRLARALGGDEGARLSVLLLAFSPFFVLTTGSLVSEVTSMFLLLVFGCLLLSGTGGLLASLGAGFCLGLAGATRGMSALAVGVPLLAWWVRSRRGRGLGSLVAGSLPPLVAMGVINGVLTGSPWKFVFTLYEPRPLGFDSSFGLAEGLRNLGSNLLLLNSWLLGWPLGLGVVAGCLWMLRRQSAVLAIGLSWFGLGGAYVLYWHGGQVATGPLRFFEICPLLVAVVGAGIAEARRRFPRHRRVVSWWVAGSVAAAALTFVPGRAKLLRAFTAGVEEPHRIVREAGLRRAIVFMSAENYLFSYPRNDLDLAHPDDVIFARDLGTENGKLVTDYPGYLTYVLRRSQDGRWTLHNSDEHTR